MRNKTKYYLIAALVGTVIGISPILFVYRLSFISRFLLFFANRIADPLFRCWFCYELIITTFIINIIIYTIFTLIIFYLVDKIKGKHKNPEK